MTVSEARADLGPATSRAECAGETTCLTEHGHRAAAIVSAGGAELLEELEDAFDAEQVRAALAHLKSSTADRVPFTRRTSRNARAVGCAASCTGTRTSSSTS